MAAAAQAYSVNGGARAIKLKLTHDASDAERVRAVREVVPDVWLGVDGNQGFARGDLEVDPVERYGRSHLCSDIT